MFGSMNYSLNSFSIVLLYTSICVSLSLCLFCFPSYLIRFFRKASLLDKSSSFFYSVGIRVLCSSFSKEVTFPKEYGTKDGSINSMEDGSSSAACPPPSDGV